MSFVVWINFVANQNHVAKQILRFESTTKPLQNHQQNSIKSPTKTITGCYKNINKIDASNLQQNQLQAVITNKLLPLTQRCNKTKLQNKITSANTLQFAIKIHHQNSNTTNQTYRYQSIQRYSQQY